MYLLGLVKRPSAVVAPENWSGQSSTKNDFLFESTGVSRDMEVQIATSGTTHKVYLRYDGSRAYYFYRGNSSFTIGIQDGLDETTNYDADPSDYVVLHSGSTLTAGATLVFGVSGFDIYVRVNGVETIRFKDHHHCAVGKAAHKCQTGVTFTGTVTFLTPASLYSSPSTQTYDPRDFGAIASLSTTGSISASSTTLTVASATNFAVGQHVIVEIGGEAGAGARGTAGVGGTWPSLSYANAAARAADTSQAANTWAWQVDTGAIYRWVSSSWVVQSSNYYTTLAIPRSLVAQITAISGNDLTLSVAATTTTTNANVYLDCAPAITLLSATNYGGHGHGTLTDFNPETNILFPAGTFYFSGTLNLPSNCTMRGVGDTTILKSPKGVPSMSMLLNGQTGTVSDVIYPLSYVKMVGNVRDAGYGLAWATTPTPSGSTGSGMAWTYTQPSSTVTQTSEIYYPSGAWMSGCTYATVRYVTSQDGWQKAVGADNCTECWADHCTHTQNDALQYYVQWMFQWANCTGGGMVDCAITSTYLIAGIEVFQCDGSDITRFTGTNAIISTNTAGGYVIDSPNITITLNSQYSSSFSNSNPIININPNQGGTPSLLLLGGSILSPTISNTYINASNDLLSAIVVNSTCVDVAVTGGTITCSDFLSGGRTNFCSMLSSGGNTDVTSLTVTGKSVYNVNGSGNRNIHLIGGSGSSATSCTAGDIYVNP